MSHEAVKWAMHEAPMPRTEKGKPDTTARHVLAVLAQHVREGGSEAWPGVDRIQHATGYDRRTVQRALRRLEDAKLIRDTGNGRSSTRYSLAMDLIRPSSDWEEIEAEEQRQRKATAERVRRHRARVTHAESVTETDAEAVTGPDVTHAESVRNAFESRYAGDVTHSASVRNARSAARTVSEPSEEEPSLGPSVPDGAIPGQTCLVAAAEEAAQETAAPKKRRAANSTTAPDEFPVTDPMREWAAAQGLTDPRHLTHQTELFLDHHRAKGSKFRDWTAAWRTWMRRSREYAPRAAQQRTPASSHTNEWMHQ